MKGIKEEDKCKGWEVGSCPDRKDMRAVIGSCKYCGLDMTASTKLRLCEIVISHMQTELGADCRKKDEAAFPKKWKLIDQKKMDSRGGVHIKDIIGSPTKNRSIIFDSTTDAASEPIFSERTEAKLDLNASVNFL
mmetsp:Transcript_5802/g.8072  ORF Transcript_5802/g.8072 Transcript_5802/m.8072 type:complete len:135 (+) Transcript_5802:173-577(+)|eukprot:CAMPEP_0184484952 /NCGR_PEP_ID=MMETSP0113_2-20130426/6613_1 /TAXON_ID=91329 /ORGANISM="Norrisiella sphaerica, Strain BC52" /LENGTH=134 /DNA_ID=CAMNT_0026866181 /DNA_START=203 /DNA_END=607 /DNA_ORIENTATION=-